MKQLILAAGKGTRLGIGETNKCLVKINGKTLLDYNLELGNEIHREKTILVVGHNEQYIRDYMSIHYQNLSICYVRQQPLQGIAHAVMLASEKIDSSFFMCLSDELLFKPKIKQMLDFFNKSGADCVCGMVADSIDNIKKSYTMDINNDKKITRLVEKPHEVFNSYKGTGYCMMSQSMLSVLIDLKPNKVRNEYEMGDWIQLAIDKGLKCFSYEIAKYDFNINEPNDITAVMRAFAEECK
jgi:dTDP-glucose pyrophosphorylase